MVRDESAAATRLNPDRLDGVEPALLQAIREASYAGLLTLRVRALEIGGILTRLPQPDSPANELHPVECEYRYGPRLKLSVKDRASLAVLVGNLRRSGRKIAGWVRSVGTGDSDLSTSDLEIVREFVPECSFILIAEPLHTGYVVVRKFQPDASGEWSESGRARIAPAASAALPTPVFHSVAEPVPTPVTASRGWRSPGQARRALALATAVAVSVLLGLAYSVLRLPSATPPVLNAEVRDGSVFLTWDAVLLRPPRSRRTRVCSYATANRIGSWESSRACWRGAPSLIVLRRAILCFNSVREKRRARRSGVIIASPLLFLPFRCPHPHPTGIAGSRSKLRVLHALVPQPSKPQTPQEVLPDPRIGSCPGPLLFGTALAPAVRGDATSTENQFAS